jgi:uncharacterized repeat protein (TIGR01451 family)
MWVLTPKADLRITKTDGLDTANAGDLLRYVITVVNLGPSDVPEATVQDLFPADFDSVAWSCLGAGGASCGVAAGSGNIRAVVSVPAQGIVTFVAEARLAPATSGLIRNVASVSAPEEFDPSNNEAADETLIVASPPDCSPAKASVEVLWPPNHSLLPVGVVGVTGGVAPVVIRIQSVFQDEPVNDRGDGNTAPDAVLASDGSARIRAERSGLGDGRVYHLFFVAKDHRGQSCEGSVTVCVPHDAAHPCQDRGALYDSTAP